MMGESVDWDPGASAECLDQLANGRDLVVRPEEDRIPATDT